MPVALSTPCGPHRRLLRAFDLICLANSIFVSAGLVRAFGGSMTSSQMLQAVLYGVIACVQLLVMLLMPATYQQYRFRVSSWLGNNQHNGTNAGITRESPPCSEPLTGSSAWPVCPY